MVLEGHARLLLARFDAELITGHLFLIHEETMTFEQGASTRDSSHTFRHALAARFWTALTAAKRLGLTSSQDSDSRSPVPVAHIAVLAFAAPRCPTLEVGGLAFKR